jgi:hypothetical protein
VIFQWTGINSGLYEPPGGADIAISIRSKCDAGGIADKRCHLCTFEMPVDRLERRGRVARYLQLCRQRFIDQLPAISISVG